MAPEDPAVTGLGVDPGFDPSDDFLLARSPSEFDFFQVCAEADEVRMGVDQSRGSKCARKVDDPGHWTSEPLDRPGLADRDDLARA